LLAVALILLVYSAIYFSAADGNWGRPGPYSDVV
jgi:hypothetical protein